MQLVANKGSYESYFCSRFFSFLFWSDVVFYKNNKKNCFGLIYVHFICLSHHLIFSIFFTVKSCVHTVFFPLLFFFFWCSIWRGAKRSKPVNVWFGLQIQVFCMFLSFHDNKNEKCCFPNLFTSWKKNKNLGDITCVEVKRVFV